MCPFPSDARGRQLSPKCAGGRLRKKVSINISKFPFCPDDCVLYRFVAFRLSVAVGRFHTSGFPLLIYTPADR